ncbi:DUF4258 domain-containing protein [Acinetobacter sp. NEB149]|uniref:DUF4258 domain-containing protein n=1 Tax=Acinetobacter TaxID=469 RepID=UPI001448DBBC|nr:DUF4258 domain-containing protein [Acinetobacter sp. NEB149]QJB50263.1 DUF4258 domain-containing protein [Acinetobacter sp. NEB149]
MKYTYHSINRMNTRGISKEMIEFTLNYGSIDGDAYVTNRKLLNKVIKHLTKQLALAKKLIDKGGVVVVTDNSSVITTYDYESYKAY